MAWHGCTTYMRMQDAALHHPSLHFYSPVLCIEQGTGKVPGPAPMGQSQPVLLLRGKHVHTMKALVDMQAPGAPFPCSAC